MPPSNISAALVGKYEGSHPLVSLIIATYNWPEALLLCLKSAAGQSILPGEVVIADDGSSAETRTLIESLRVGFPVPLKHVWHPDKGFRKAEILNKSVQQCSYDYIIQVDGDVILHRDFVADHIQAAEAGAFVRGSRARLTPEATESILKGSGGRLRYYSPGVLNRLNAVRLPLLRFLAHRKKMCSRSVRGSNLAYWKKDFINANGYNNELQGWGHEDEELAARFINNNIIKKIVKLTAVQFHLHHTELKKGLEPGHKIVLDNVRVHRHKTCHNGFQQLI